MGGMVFVLLELGCIECGDAKATEIVGSFPTLEEGLDAMRVHLDEDNEDRTARGWYPLTIETRPEGDDWSASLVAHAGEAGWRLQLHKVGE